MLWLKVQDLVHLYEVIHSYYCLYLAWATQRFCLRSSRFVSILLPVSRQRIEDIEMYIQNHHLFL